MDQPGHESNRVGVAGEGRSSRRDVLRWLGIGGIGVAAARAADNVLVGYGLLAGTNLRRQSLGPLASEQLDPSPFSIEVSGTTVEYDGARVRLATGEGAHSDTLSIAGAGADRARALDEEYGLDGEPLAQLVADLPAISAGEVEFEFADREAFFDRLEGTRTRPFTVAALRGRGFRRPTPATIRTFTGSDPADTRSLVTGLAEGFRAHTRYDFSRYARRSIQFNVLFDRVELDRRSRTDYGAILDGSTSALLCWDYTYRSIEAFHAVPPHRQTLPVVGAITADRRHGHVYTGLASVVRDGGGLGIPMTFLDYRNATLLDGFGWMAGDGIDAYDGRHRASRISWDR